MIVFRCKIKQGRDISSIKKRFRSGAISIVEPSEDRNKASELIHKIVGYYTHAN
ncbi:MAG: hypothetical protein HQL06_13055 [Nitrospirae bacterium]|nr:hypothetical protein [Nitrospirota bacterium]